MKKLIPLLMLLTSFAFAEGTHRVAENRIDVRDVECGGRRIPAEDFLWRNAQVEIIEDEEQSTEGLSSNLRAISDLLEAIEEQENGPGTVKVRITQASGGSHEPRVGCTARVMEYQLERLNRSASLNQGQRGLDDDRRDAKGPINKTPPATSRRE